MSTMQGMAVEYRAASARLAMRLKKLRSDGADPQVLHALSRNLRELRAVQRTLDGYYTLPRDPEITSAGWRGRGPSQDDH